MPQVRLAAPNDADELARLRWTFRLEHGTPVSRTFEEFLDEFRPFAGEVLADGSPWRAWVAEHEDGRLAGCLWLQLVEKVPHPSRGRWERPIGYVTNVYVEPDLRNDGLGVEVRDVAEEKRPERDGRDDQIGAEHVAAERGLGGEVSPVAHRHRAGNGSA